jgi:hypothetical protein
VGKFGVTAVRTHPLLSLCQNPEIPPTVVGGFFRFNLLDASAHLLESHPRKVGGCFKSGPFPLTFEHCRRDLNNPPLPWVGFKNSVTAVCRLDLNLPPTAVGGIPEF